MSEKPVYYDKRSDFWKNYWEKAFQYDDYVKKADIQYRERWIDSEKRISDLSEEQKNRLMGYNRNLKVLIYSGIWCGDCSRQGPIIKKIADTCGEKVQIRLIERETSQELQDELRIVGALRVPIMVFLSEDYWEIGRYGERTLSVYRSKLARETNMGKEKGILSPQARERELAEWVEIFERILIMLRLSPPLRRRYGD